jgi:hypothetical protein
MAGARDRLAPEGEVAIVELELVQLRHALESAGRRSHQLGPHPVSGETGNRLDIHAQNLLKDIVGVFAVRPDFGRTSPAVSRRMRRQTAA